MSAEHDAQARLESLIDEHVRRGNVVPFPDMSKRRKKQGDAQATKVSVNGTGNAAVVGSHNKVTINNVHKSRKVVADVKPGEDHITDREAAELREMVHQLHANTGKSFQLIWSTLLRQVHAPTYRLIPLDQYQQAEAYLRKWLAHANDADPEASRKRHIRYIKTNQRKLDRPDGDLTDFLQAHFGKDGLRQCTVDELVVVRNQLVANWRHQF